MHFMKFHFKMSIKNYNQNKHTKSRVSLPNLAHFEKKLFLTEERVAVVENKFKLATFVQ